MSRKTQKETAKVRILVDCHLGKCNHVAEMSGEAAAIAVSEGLADDSPAAVAYAESLTEE